MFVSIIDKEIIEDTWRMFDCNYENTISSLANMVEDIEHQQPKPQMTEETKQSGNSDKPNLG